jgi:hypothetical protein
MASKTDKIKEGFARWEKARDVKEKRRDYHSNDKMFQQYCLIVFMLPQFPEII